MMNNKYRSLAKDTVIFAIGNFGTKILTFLCVSLYTAYLTTSEFGEADLLNTTISLLLPVFTLAIAEASLRFLYDKDVKAENVYSVSLIVVICSSILVVVLSYLSAFFFPDFRKYTLFFIIIYALTAVEGVFSNLSKGLGYSKVFAIKGIIHSAVFICSNIVLLTVLKLGLNGYFVSYIISYIASISYMFVGAKLFNIRFTLTLDGELFRKMLLYSIPFIPATISWWINSSADKYMLVWLVGTESNGLYSVAQKVPTIITTVTGIFTQAWQLSAMQSYEEDDFSSFFSQMFKFISAILIFGASLVFILNKDVISRLLFRNDFYQAWKYVPMLTVAAVFSTLAGFLASAFTSAKKTNMLFISTMIGAVVNILINYLLIVSIGTIGAAVATALSFLVMVVIRLITMKKIVSLNANYFKLIISGVLMLFAAIAAPYVKYYYVLMGGVVIMLAILNYHDFINVTRFLISKIRRNADL